MKESLKEINETKQKLANDKENNNENGSKSTQPRK